MKKKFDFNFKRSKEEQKEFEQKPSKKEFVKVKAKAPSAELVTLYVGNLSYQKGQRTIKALFTPFGTVKTVSIVLKEGTQLKTGFAFVTMEGKANAQKAIEALNGTIVDDRTLKVSIANSRF